MTSMITELVDYGYTIMSVGGKTTKQPLNSSGYGLEKWEHLPHKEIMKHINTKGKRFGLRTGKQGNDRYIASLDWDCCGKKGKDGRLGCDYTKEKLQKYNDIKTCDDGMFKGGTAGNFNLLFDFTDIPELRERFQQLIDEGKGKKKIELQSLEIFYSNGAHQVIPPSATLSKITGEIGASREFLNERPFIVLNPDMPETNYIRELLNEFDTMKKPVKKPVKVSSVTPSSSEDEMEVMTKVMTEYDDMIINGLGKKRLKMDEYLRLASVLKSNNVSYAIWSKWNTECCNVDDNHHVELWDTCEVDKNLKMSFVVGMCKKYDENYYRKWIMKQTSYMIDECVKDEQKLLWCDFSVKVPKRTFFTDVAFGDIFQRLYGDKFRFTNGFIYHFNGVYWERDNKQYSNINCFIDSVFYQDLKKWILGKILYWTKKAGETEDDDDKNNKGIAFWTRVNLSVKDYIKTQRSKAELIKSICSKVCNDSQEWDLNPYAFVFKNCVFDLKLGKKVESNPQDFMTTCCGWDYDDNYKDVGIEKFIETIQTERIVGDYLMKAYYSCMVGIQSRNVYILTGSGGNGKSVLDELLMSMLGGYGYALPKAFLTQPFKDGANPEAIALHNKRCVIVSEPDAKKNICCSSLKALSGDSKISSRKLYGEIESVNIVATSIVECNTPPNLDEMNDAMSDRLGEGVIHFNSKFVKQSVYDAMSEDERIGKQVGNDYYKEEDFKIESRQSLFNYLLGYRDKKVAVPNSVKQSSKVYLAKSDIFYDWFNDNYEVDNESVIRVKDVYYEFKNDNYDAVRSNKQDYGTEKNFTSVLRSNIFVRKYIKERREYYNGDRLPATSLVGWTKKEEEEEEDIDCDASTIVDE